VRCQPDQSGRSWDRCNAIYSLQRIQTKCTQISKFCPFYTKMESCDSELANQLRTSGMTPSPPGIASSAPNAPFPPPPGIVCRAPKRTTLPTPAGTGSNGLLKGCIQIVRTYQIVSESYQTCPSLSAYIDLYQSYVIDRYQTNPDSYQMSGIIRTLHSP
jgi:hypothetical protein